MISKLMIYRSNYLVVIFITIFDRIEKNLNIFTDVDTPVSGKLSQFRSSTKIAVMRFLRVSFTILSILSFLFTLHTKIIYTANEYQIPLLKIHGI